MAQEITPSDMTGGKFVDDMVFDLAAATTYAVDEFIVLLHGNLPVSTALSFKAHPALSYLACPSGMSFFNFSTRQRRRWCHCQSPIQGRQPTFSSSGDDLYFCAGRPCFRLKAAIAALAK